MTSPGTPPSQGDDVAVAYDTVPYEGGAYQTTHVERLYVLGRLFGVTPQDPAHARVLEIGCASGANLVPMADRYPDSRFVGIDISPRQIEDAAAFARSVGVANTDFRTLSVADLDASLGPFDYIICHGVYSWVSEEVQEAILRACKANLAPNGVALVSYNTLPGWNMVRSVRDMMRYHVSQLADPAQRATQARLLLRFMRDSLDGETGDSPYGAFLDQELRSLEMQPDAYLLHDHLEADNNPCYFHEFVARARNAGLSYVAEASIESMFIGNLGKAARDVLAQIPDIERQEQYMDFLRNRRFRSTLLCHETCDLTRDLSRLPLAEFAIRSALVPRDGPAAVDLATDARADFVVPATGIGVTSGSRVMSALLMVLYEQRRQPLPVRQLVEKAAERTGGFAAALVMKTLGDFAPDLLLRGAITLYADAGAYVATVSTRPLASAVARYLAARTEQVVNRRHEVLRVADFQRMLIGMLDGSMDTNSIVDLFAAKIEAGEASLPADRAGQNVREALHAIIYENLDKLAEHAFLVE